jgi:hypothetical protein
LQECQGQQQERRRELNWNISKEWKQHEHKHSHRWLYVIQHAAVSVAARSRRVSKIESSPPVTMISLCPQVSTETRRMEVLDPGPHLKAQNIARLPDSVGQLRVLSSHVPWVKSSYLLQYLVTVQHIEGTEVFNPIPHRTMALDDLLMDKARKQRVRTHVAVTASNTCNLWIV